MSSSSTGPEVADAGSPASESTMIATEAEDIEAKIERLAGALEAKYVLAHTERHHCPHWFPLLLAHR